MIKRRSGLIINMGYALHDQGRSRSRSKLVQRMATSRYLGVVYTVLPKLRYIGSPITWPMELKGFGIDVLLLAPGGIRSGFGERQASSIKLRKGLKLPNFHNPRRASHLVCDRLGLRKCLFLRQG